MIGFQIAEDLGLMLVANSVQLNETATSKLVGGGGGGMLTSSRVLER